jgi:hypothetical protein
MNARWFCLAALAMAPFAAADTVKLLPSALEMPDRIGPLTYTGKPNSWPDKRLGSAYSFSTPGMALDVYVYDGGIADIPDGAASRAVCEQFEEAKSGVLQGGYRNVVLKREQLARMGPTLDPPLMREAVFEATMKEVPSVSYVWITGASKNFIKMRFSANAQLRDELEDARRAVLTALGDAIRPHLAPVAPAGEKKSASSIVVNGSAVDDMMLGILYLGTISTLADETPELQPPCGGPVVLHYEGEVGAYQAALAFADGDAGGSKFAKRLQEIAKAGYLEEFVWTYRHQDSWGDAPPAGLELDAFKKWGKKHLKRFRAPIFGYVEFNEPKPLPIEPL